MAGAWAKKASSSSITPQPKYEVFLSFSGIDTRKNFTGHLFAALKRHGFHTFRDDEKLERGEDIGSELLKAIEESRISVIVFSENYAASKWCLDELVKIMECKETFQHVVLPIFYNVVPSDVRWQRGSLAEKFAKHEERFKEDSDGKVKKWRAALNEAVNLSGWELKNVANGDEAKLIEEVVKRVENILAHELYVANHPVGVEDRVQELMSMLPSMESNDVCIVGVLGIGGIGKTTIAKRLYNIVRHKFESSSFLANVRETSNRHDGFVTLQERLLSDVFKNETYHIKDVHHGKEVIKRRALCRKVLLVLDDVDSDEQLKELAIDRDCFGSGSRIIITTRNEFLLDSLKVDWVYTQKELNKWESIQLFSWHAFHKKGPLTKDYLELSDLVVDYAQGLPLVLEVLGSLLYNRSIPYWRSAIEEFKKTPHDNIQRKLKISYDSLREKEKELFLDLACFFVVIDEDFTVKILKGCNLSAKNGFQGLADRCLIKYDPYCKNFVMHDLLRDMGREIVRQESHEPGRRSRVWSHDDALEVLRNGTGTEAVEGILLNFLEPKKFQVNAKAFEKMNRLRLLHLNNVHPSIGNEHIFGRLSWLRWTSFPQKCMPSNLSMENLIALDLSYSKLEQVWKGTKDFHAHETSDYSPLDQDFHASESSDYNFLEQNIRALEYPYYSIDLSGSEVPRLSEYQSTGSYLSFRVPLTPLINQKKVQGLLVCLVFNVPKEIIERNVYSRCTSTIQINKVKISDSFCSINGDDQMWVRFVPTKQLKGGDEVEISLTASDMIQFIKCGCGANIVYEIDDVNVSTEKTNDEELTRYTPHHLTPTLILEEEEDEEGEEFFDATN